MVRYSRGKCSVVIWRGETPVVNLIPTTPVLCDLIGVLPRKSHRVHICSQDRSFSSFYWLWYYSRSSFSSILLFVFSTSLS